jgi:hypothetical protein
MDGVLVEETEVWGGGRNVDLMAQRRITVTKIGSGSTPEHK